MGLEIVHRQEDQRSSARIVAFTIFIIVTFASGVVNQQYLHSKLLGLLVTIIETAYVGFICFTLAICGALIGAIPFLMKSAKATGNSYTDSTIQSFSLKPFDFITSLFYPATMYFAGHPVLAEITIVVEVSLITLGLLMTGYRNKYRSK